MTGQSVDEDLEKRVARLEKRVEQYRGDAEKYRALFENFPHGISVLDGRGNILETNAAAEKLLGLSKSKHEKRTLDSRAWHILRPDGSDMPIEEWAGVVALREKRQVSDCIGIAEPGYETKWISVIAAPVSIEGEGVVITFSEIADRKCTEQALRQNQYRHRSILKTAMDGFWLTDSKGRIIEVNDAYCRMSGYDETELLQMHISDLEAIEDGQQIAEHIRKVHEIGEDRFETCHRRKDGSIFDVEISIQYRAADGGQSICFLRDITERKETEDALRQSEEQYRQVVETVNEGIILQAASGEILSWNKEAQRLFGITAEKAVGKTSEGADWPTIREDGTPYPGKDHPSMVTLRTGRPLRDKIMGVEQPSGEIRWISINTSPIKKKGEDRPSAVAISFRDVTEIRTANEKLEQSRKELQRTLDATTDGIWSWDFLANTLDFSPNYYTMLGYVPYEFPADYDHWIGLIHPEDRKKALAVAEKYLKTKPDIYENQFRLKTKKGKYRWIKAQARVVERDENNAAIRMIGSHVDITDTKNYEQALLDKKAELEQILSAIPDALVYSDTERRIVRVNASFEKTFGYSPSDVLGERTEILYASKDSYLQQGRERYNINAGVTLKPYFTEYRRKNGEIFPTESVGTTVCDTSGRVIGFLGLVRDISHTKQAEKALMETKQKYQSMIDNIGIGVALINPDMAVIEMNRQMRQWHPDVDVTRRPLCFRVLNDPARGQICEGCPAYKTMKDGKAHELLTGSDERKDSRIYRIVSSPIFNEQNQVEAAIEMVEDITERQKFEAQVRHAQRMESIGNLAGGIAHDFNNILFPIVGMSELLLEDLPHRSPEWENAQEILTAGKRGSDLVKQILAFSRQVEHKLLPVRIQHILKEVLMLSRSTIPSYIEITQEIQSDCGMVKADATQIHQVAMNLMTNAFHAIEEKGGTITVQLRETELTDDGSSPANLTPGKYARLSITDTGCGMPADLVSRIFDPYFTTKEQGKGTGLGLAVVHGIVKEHGGEITVRSEIGKGSNFNVYLPLVDRTNRADVGTPGQELETGDEKILLVDDERTVANLEKQMLERLGYSVTMRVNSLEALALFRARSDDFDLILSDMAMPNMTGDEFAIAVKSVRPDIPVILCTGFSERIKNGNEAELRVSGILMKPIVRSEMARTVRKVLDQAQELR